MSKRIKLLLVSVLAAVGLLVPLAAIQAEDILDPVCANNPNATLCEENQNENINNNRIFGPSGILTKAAQVIALVTGVASVVMIIISGVQYSFSGGDPARLNTAKNTLLYALIGVVIAMSAQAIIVFVLKEI